MRRAGRCVEQRGGYRLYECFMDGIFAKARGGGEGVRIMVLADARGAPVAVSAGADHRGSGL